MTATTLGRSILKTTLILAAVLLLLAMVYAARGLINAKDVINDVQYREIYQTVLFCKKGDAQLRQAIRDSRISHGEYNAIMRLCADPSVSLP